MMNIYYTVLAILSAGILPLVCYFYPLIKLQLTTVTCTPDNAEFAHVIVGTRSDIYYAAVSSSNETNLVINAEDKHIITAVTHYNHLDEHVVVLEIKTDRYIGSSYDKFKLYKVPSVPVNFKRFLIQNNDNSKDRRKMERDILISQYGANTMAIPETSLLDVIVRQALSPFFLFQYFAIILWFYEGYYFYTCFILVITVSSVYFNVSEVLYNLERLKKLAGNEGTVQVVDEDNINSSGVDDGVNRLVYTAPDSVLVPGDRFLITEGMTLPCDCILINGRAIVDESMLTGESVPVNKLPIDISGIGGNRHNNPLDKCSLAEAHDSNRAEDYVEEIDLSVKRSANILFGGTRVRQCKSTEVVAVAYRTSFRSSKGQLVGTLLDDKNEFLSFFADALVVILCMLLLVSIIYIYFGIRLRYLGASTSEVFIYYLDVITNAIPPALTACLSIATAVCVVALKDDEIYVTDTTRLNWAGMVSAVSFDKTGTLTEETLNFQGVSVVSTSITGEAVLTEHIYSPNQTSFFTQLPPVMLETLATCHSLSLLSSLEAATATPVGDPLEIELLKVSRWSLFLNDRERMCARPYNNPSSVYEIIKHFEFNADRLRAATLLGRPGNVPNKYAYLVKGSPEVIMRLCDQDSLPQSLSNKLLQYTKKGYRVIAVAYKEFSNININDLASTSQEDIEAQGGIKFLGLIYLSSKLKAETVATIKELTTARIHTNMITGDHIHTAIAVAIDVGILKHYGASTNVLYIIDEDERNSGSLCITDAYSNEVISNDLDLDSLLNLMSISTLDECKLRRQILYNLPKSTKSSQTFDGPIQLAVTGRGLQLILAKYPKNVVDSLVRHTQVFARTKPADKKLVVDYLLSLDRNDDRLVQLVEQYEHLSINSSSSSTSPKSNHFEDSNSAQLFINQNKDEHNGKFMVLFCGDGANDIAALRASTIGVSLCDAETSVAAPVTSRNQTPFSVVKVLQEGRRSLITAYVLVMFNLMYGTIQFIMCCYLYYFGLRVGNYMFLIQDLFYTLVLGVCIIYTAGASTISKELPPARFFTPYLLVKTISQMVCFILFQGLALDILMSQSWYTRYSTDEPLSDTYSYEATVLMNMACAQLMIASIVSGIDEPFRKPWYTNKYLVAALTGQLGFLLFMIFSGESYFYSDVLQMKALPTSFGCILFLFMVFNGVVSMILSAVANAFRPKPVHAYSISKVTLSATDEEEEILISK